MKIKQCNTKVPWFPKRNELKLCRTGNSVLCFPAPLAAGSTTGSAAGRNSLGGVEGAAQLPREAGAVFGVCCGVAGEQRTCGFSIWLGVAPNSAAALGALEQKP